MTDYGNAHPGTVALQTRKHGAASRARNANNPGQGKPMFDRILGGIPRKPPVITVALIASCLVTTIPQFFLGPGYDSLTGDASPRNFVFFPLISFSHDPRILPLHLTLNVAVFLFFGSALESVLGRSRFSLLTATTFLVSTALVFLRGKPSHGASGICWGYQAFLVFMLIVNSENAGKRARKGFWPCFYASFIAFNFVGTPAFEAMNGVRLGDNFGQYVHLASNLVAVPFLLRWRNDIEGSLRGTDSGDREQRRESDPIPIIAIGLILLYNAMATALAVRATLATARG